MGNSASIKNDTPGQSSKDGIDIDMNGVIRQSQAFYDSIQHQTNAAITLLETQHGMLKALKESNPTTESREHRFQAETLDQLERNQATLMHQMKGLQKAGESFKELVQPFREGIYPVNLHLPNEDVVQAKDDIIEALKKEASEKDRIKQQNETLQRQSTDLTNKIESIRRINASFQNDIEKAAQEKDSLRRANNSLSEEKRNLNDQISQMRRQHYLLEQEHRSSIRKIEDLRKQLETQRKRKLSVHVQLFSPRKGDLTAMVLQEMRVMLETQFEIEDRILMVNICDRLTDIIPNMASLIVCINASRLGSDVASALEGLTLNKCQGLVILHHKDTHALPNQPSERLLTSSSSDLKKLGGIFDMAFLSGKGIYTCDMNNRAVSELVTFIKAFSQPE